MAEQQTEFVYRNIELYKSESLGSGSYGGVCKAKCDGLLCAAKIMHPTLFDLRDPGTVSYLRKFQEECHLLSLARHPNVVQYLATYSDPETRLPVLLMELCDESLTGFLERSPGPLPYHTQLNISHDIALALVYLHSNGLIHRDLTGNNVLMIAGTRAKITDFGMSKLATINPRMTALTLCPGNVLYMSPEALNEHPTYTNKLDMFSFGVILVQIITRQFPNPTDRFTVIDDHRYPVAINMPVPETQRRQTHLQLISDTHPLKPSAISCLKDQDKKRPSAQQLGERLSELKLAPQYTQSMQQARAGSNVVNVEAMEDLRRQLQDLQQQNDQRATQIQQLEQQLQDQRIWMEERMREDEAKNHELRTTVEENRRFQDREHHASRELEDLRKQVHDMQITESQHQQVLFAYEQDAKRQRMERDRLEMQVNRRGEQLEAQGADLGNREKVRELRAENLKMETHLIKLQTDLEENLKRIQEKEREKAASEQLVSEFQQSLEQKDRTISDLQQTISAHEKKIQQLEQQERASGGQPRQLPVTADTPQAATASAVEKDITKLRWREGKKAPQVLERGAAVVHGNTAYFNPAGTKTIYSYQVISGIEHWSKLPTIRLKDFSLVVIDGLLTIVGGCTIPNGKDTKDLLSITEIAGRQQWSLVFPSMLRARSTTAAVTTGRYLVVVGGMSDGSPLASVEILNIDTKHWSMASHLPQPMSMASAAIHENRLYLTPGIRKTFILTCSIVDLLSSEASEANIAQQHYPVRTKAVPVWKYANDLPVSYSTLTTLSSHLLAIGGLDESHNPTASVYRYAPLTDSWHLTSRIGTKRYRCLTAVLPEDRLVVVGGSVKTSDMKYVETDSVELTQL